MSVVDSEFVTVDTQDPSADPTNGPTPTESSGGGDEESTPTGYFRWKGLIDRVVASLLLLVAAPMIGILAVIVKLSSRGPAIFSQQRVGLNGTTYTMYKLRSMANNAEATTGPTWTTTNDVRVTPVGRILRTLHLDELPQLINVIKGEMSLIGPRPERPEFVEVLKDNVSRYCDRHKVRPGVTGLAQINLPPDTDLSSVRRKQYLDIEYIQTANLWLDIRMFLCTLLGIFGLKGSCRFLGLRRHVPVEIDSDITTLTPQEIEQRNTSMLDEAPKTVRPK